MEKDSITQNINQLFEIENKDNLNKIQNNNLKNKINKKKIKKLFENKNKLNLSKKPKNLSPFWIYHNEKYYEIKKGYSFLNKKEIYNKIKTDYLNLDSKQKNHYIEIFERNNIIYKQNMILYNKSIKKNKIPKRFEELLAKKLKKKI